MDRYCFVGLGNPGKKYENTRHNIGFQWVDRVFDEISRVDSSLQWKEKYKSLWVEARYRDCEIHLLKPQTYMNLSGDAVSDWVRKNPEHECLVVICDDLDTELGRARLRKSGGDAGNRGMRSIIERLGTKEVNRLKLGIGRPSPGMDAADYVLQKFKPDEQRLVADVMDKALEQFEAVIESESIDRAMNEINVKEKSS